MSEVVAVACADIHLSHSPPQARAAEPDWYAAMRRPLEQLHAVSEEHQAPIVCAGDIFHKWNSPAELINFSLKYWPPDTVVIPGQHDLPNHRLEDVDKSVYWTLVQGHGQIRGLEYGGEYTALPGNAFVVGFPWGTEVGDVLRGRVPGMGRERGRVLLIALIHAYVWSNKTNAYLGVTPQAAVPGWKDRLAGYDVAVFGDNHKPFEAKAGGCRVFNCGGFMRRHADEIAHRPSVGLIHADGTVTRHYLDCSEDKFTDEAHRAGEILTGDDPALAEFIADLGDAGAPEALDFSAAVRRYIEETKPPAAVAGLLLEVIE